MNYLPKCSGKTIMGRGLGKQYEPPPKESYALCLVGIAAHSWTS